MSDNTVDRRAAFIAGLRGLADFLEQHPTVEAPGYNNLSAFVDTREEIAACARAASWEKIHNGPYFYLRKTFGNDLTLDICIARDEICRRVVTGKKIIPAQPEQEVDEVEWQCEDSLLAAQEAT